MGFEEVKTPLELLTPQEREMRRVNENLEAQASQFVEYESADQGTPLNLDLHGSSPSPQTPEEALTSDEKEAVLAAEQEERVKQAREERIKELRANPQVLANREAFLLEISGLRAFTKTYAYANLMQIEFTTIDMDLNSQIGRQNVSDLTQNRIRSRHPIELQNNAMEYRLIASIGSLEITDPVTQRVQRSYLRDPAKTIDAAPYIAKSLVTGLDYPVRTLWLHLMRDFITTQTLHTIIRQWFQEFEQLILDLLELLELDPSFFTGVSSTDGTPV